MANDGVGAINTTDVNPVVKQGVNNAFLALGPEEKKDINIFNPNQNVDISGVSIWT